MQKKQMYKYSLHANLISMQKRLLICKCYFFFVDCWSESAWNQVTEKITAILQDEMNLQISNMNLFIRY